MSSTGATTRTRKRHPLIAEILSKAENVEKVIALHGLEGKFLALKEIEFPHGRADLVIYGLWEDTYVIPIGVEIKSEVSSATNLFYYIEQIRNTYEHGFTYIYLATAKPGENEAEEDQAENRYRAIRKYVQELGYGLIALDIERGAISVNPRASPKKSYRSEADHVQIASQGVLFLAMKDALASEGFNEDMIAVKRWIGLKTPINYFASIKDGNAITGVYGLGVQRARKLLRAIQSNREIIKTLSERGYRIHISSYIVRWGVRGSMLYLDRRIDPYIIERTKIPKSLEKGWGISLMIYKKLWNTTAELPSYQDALAMLKNELNSLKALKQLMT